MDRVELKKWAREKINNNFWLLVGTLIVASFITSFTYATFHYADGHVQSTTISFGWIFYFVEVGMTYFMVKYINDEMVEFKDIFHFSSDFVRCLLQNLLQLLFVALWSLLFIIPGIIKGFAYALVPYLLADSKYKDLGYMDILKKSEEMMDGHKGDLFVLGLSFIGWHLLAVLTCGILEIWVVPYQKTATTKFLNDIKLKYEGKTLKAETKEEVKAEKVKKTKNKK